MSEPPKGSGRGPANDDGLAAIALGIAIVAVVIVAHQDVIPVLVMPLLVGFFILSTDRWATKRRSEQRLILV